MRTRDRRVLARFRPRGVVRAVAVSRRHAVVVAAADGITRLESRDPSTGRLQRTVTLPGPVVSAGAVVPDVPLETASTSGDFAVVVHGQHEIWIVDLRTGSRLTVDRGTADLVGVSLAGRRLVWGENAGRAHRVLELALPAA